MSDLKDVFGGEGLIQNIPALMVNIQRKVREFSLAQFSQNGQPTESKYQYIAVIMPDDYEPDEMIEGAHRCHVYKVPKFVKSTSDKVELQQIADISVQKEYIWMQYSYGCNGYEEKGDRTIVVNAKEFEDFIRNFTARVMPLIADPEDRFLIGLARHNPEIHLIHGK